MVQHALDRASGRHLPGITLQIQSRLYATDSVACAGKTNRSGPTLAHVPYSKVPGVPCVAPVKAPRS